jgi:hypothetical protein
MAAQQWTYNPTISFTKSGGTFCPTTVASLELLPQIQQLGRPQQQRVPHHPLSLLHLQAERETSNVTAAKGLDMLCVIAPPSVFWS